MAVYIADEDELRHAFPDWRRPAATPSLRSAQNPFTGQSSEVMAWVPDPTDVGIGNALPVTSSNARLASLLASSISERFREWHLAALIAVVLGGTGDEWVHRLVSPPPLVEPEGYPGVHFGRSYLAVFSTSFVDALAALSDEALSDFARRWSEAISADVPRDGLDDYAGSLRELRANAHRARATKKRIYYFSP